jgi:hypothetical protein
MGRAQATFRPVFPGLQGNSLSLAGPGAGVPTITPRLQFYHFPIDKCPIEIMLCGRRGTPNHLFLKEFDWQARELVEISYTRKP